MHKLLSKLLVLTFLFGIIPIYNSNAASTVGWPIPTRYDMSNNIYPVSYMANLNEGAYGYFSDPTDPTNTVLGIKSITRSDGIVSGTDLRSLVQNTDSAIEFTFDIYREDSSAIVQLEVKPADNASYGTRPDKAFMFTTGQAFSQNPTNGTSCPVENNKWYTFKLLFDKNRTSLSISYKQRGALKYELCQNVDMSTMDFDGRSIMYYFKNQSLKGFTYLDNMSWSEVEDVTFDMVDGEADIPINPTITATINADIDVNESSVECYLTAEDGTTVNATTALTSSQITIVPDSALCTDTYYTLSATIDFLLTNGERLKTVYELKFLTIQPICVSNVTLNSSSNLGKAIAGNNAFNYTLTSNDGLSHPYTALMIAYDKTTGERLAVSSKGGVVSATGTTKTYLNLNLSGFSNFTLECYIWSGTLTMKPMTKAYIY